jgi:hypothetical protein
MVGGGAGGGSGDGIRPCSADGNGTTCAIAGIGGEHADPALRSLLSPSGQSEQALTFY